MELIKSKSSVSDCVIFMSAYKSNYSRKKMISFYKNKSEKKSEILNKHHISSILIDDSFFTVDGILKFEPNHDAYHQKTSFEFKLINEKDDIDKFQKYLKETKWCLSLKHSVEILLDPFKFEVSSFINMESFLIFINNRKLQVDPIIFFINEVMFICFELINFDTREPFNKDEIYGRSNNYNVKIIKEMQFFGTEEIITVNKKIPDIIFENINSLLQDILRDRFVLDNTSFLHNLFVISDFVEDMSTYFQDVLGEKITNMQLDNISGHDSFNYFSQEYLGVVTLADGQYKTDVLWDTQVLEILKMYICLNQIINYDLTLDLKNTLDEKMHTEQLLFMSRVPIITVKAITNMQNTASFERYKESINFKISYLTMYYERRKNRNALLLNVLLYVISFIGSVGTFQILQEEFGLSFKISFIALTSVFFLLGVIWIYLERKK